MPKDYMKGICNDRFDAMSDKEIVVLARNIKGKSQADFGLEVGKSQSVVSKYEKGLTVPPSDVLSHCVTILMASRGVAPLSLDQVVSKLRQAESLPQAPCLYQAINAVIDAFAMGARMPSIKN